MSRRTVVAPRPESKDANPAPRGDYSKKEQASPKKTRLLRPSDQRCKRVFAPNWRVIHRLSQASTVPGYRHAVLGGSARTGRAAGLRPGLRARVKDYPQRSLVETAI